MNSGAFRASAEERPGGFTNGDRSMKNETNRRWLLAKYPEGRKRSAVEQAYNYAINLPCDWIIVTNLALPLTPMQGDEWEEDVQQWTLARFRIPSGENVSDWFDPKAR